MIDVMHVNRSRATRVVAKADTMHRAECAMRIAGIQWECTKPGRAWKKLSPNEIGLYFSDGKPAGTIFINATAHLAPVVIDAETAAPGKHGAN